MAVLDLRRDGNIFVLTMQSGENRFNRPFLDALNRALDEVEGSTGPAALVTTGGEGKFYSNGLDLGWLSGLVMASSTLASCLLPFAVRLLA